jgi:hypothetical protein
MTLSKRLFGGAMVTATGAAIAMGSAGLAHADVTPANTPPVDTIPSSAAFIEGFNNAGAHVGYGAAGLLSNAVVGVVQNAQGQAKELVMLPTNMTGNANPTLP